MATPKPQPTVLRMLRGNPGKRAINHREPQHQPLSLECPAELTDPAARLEWDRLATALIQCGQVTAVDRATFIGYCQKWAQWQALEREAAQHPFLVRAPSGYPIPNPALCMANKAFNLVLKAANELGITPSSRSRVQATPVVGASDQKWAGILP